MNSAEQIRVVMVAEHALFRAGLREIVRDAPEVNVVADSADASEGVALVRQTQAQVLIVERPVGGEDAATVARMVSSAMIHTNLLVLTTLGSQVALESLLLAGVRGYLTRAATEPALLDAIRTVARGAQYRCRAHITLRQYDAPGPMVAEAERRQFERLTERERDVLVATAQGYTAPEIGARLHISAKTVDTYKQRIHDKLGLHHRTDYVRLAMKLHLMETG